MSQTEVMMISRRKVVVECAELVNRVNMAVPEVQCTSPGHSMKRKRCLWEVADNAGTRDIAVQVNVEYSPHNHTGSGQPQDRKRTLSEREEPAQADEPHQTELNLDSEELLSKEFT